MIRESVRFLPAGLMLTLLFLGTPLSTTAHAQASPEDLMAARHWKQLRRIVEPRAAANPKDAQAAYLLSCTKMAFGDVDAALALAEQAVALEPGNSKYHYQLGLANGQKANKASFFSAMKFGNRYKTEIFKAVDLDPKNVEARWELMEFYFNAPAIAGGDRQKGRTVADEIMRLDAATGHLALGEAAERSKQPAEAEVNYRKAAEADPKNYPAQMAPAWLCLSDENKKYDLAERYARQAIALDPGRSAGYSALARALAAEERWQELDALLAQAEKLVPEDLSPAFQAAVELLLSGKDPQRAERYLRKYLTQEPEGQSPPLSRAHWRLGQALEKQGRKNEAIAEMESALRLEPSLDPAKKDLKRLKS
jgi:tetratricopeptide (TPR) repeat protein